MSDGRWTPEGVRLCDERSCELPATHTMVWTDDWQCYCMIHANKMLAIGQALGHGAPRLTIRQMTITEMVKDDDST